MCALVNSGKMCQQGKSYRLNWSRRKVCWCQWSFNWGWLCVLGLWNTEFSKCHAHSGTVCDTILLWLYGRFLLLDHSDHRIWWRLALQKTSVPGMPKGILLDMVGMSMLFMVHCVYYYVYSYKAQSNGDCFYEGKEQINILEGSRLRNQENDCAYMASLWRDLFHKL